MNLTDKALEIITQIQHQAPDVAAQMVAFEITSSLIWAIVLTAVFAAILWAFFHEYESSYDADMARTLSFYRRADGSDFHLPKHQLCRQGEVLSESISGGKAPEQMIDDLLKPKADGTFEPTKEAK